MTETELTRYAVFLVDYADPGKRSWDDFDAEEQQRVMEQHVAFAKALDADPRSSIVAGEALSEVTAHVFRRRDGQTFVTDGAYAEATEQIGGLYLIDAPDLDTLVGHLELMPTYVMEIRPTVDV